eukprot:scaffold172_cov254-Pinguiococcus_pyrenoidosus.AAC.38
MKNSLHVVVKALHRLYGMSVSVAREDGDSHGGFSCARNRCCAAKRVFRDPKGHDGSATKAAEKPRGIHEAAAVNGDHRASHGWSVRRRDRHEADIVAVAEGYSREQPGVAAVQGQRQSHVVLPAPRGSGAA